GVTVIVTMLSFAFVSLCGIVRLADAVLAIGADVPGALTVTATVACAPFARSPSVHEIVDPPVHEPAVVVTPAYVSEAGSDKAADLVSSAIGSSLTPDGGAPGQKESGTSRQGSSGPQRTAPGEPSRRAIGSADSRGCNRIGSPWMTLQMPARQQADQFGSCVPARCAAVASASAFSRARRAIARRMYPYPSIRAAKSGERAAPTVHPECAARKPQIACAAGVKKSPYQNSAQTQPQRAKANAFARRKKITPRRLGMGRMYCFASDTAAQPNGGGAPQSTTVTQRLTLSCSVCPRGSNSATTNPNTPGAANRRARMARSNARAGAGLPPCAACTRSPATAIPGVRPQSATKIQDQAIASTAARATQSQAAAARASLQPRCPAIDVAASRFAATVDPRSARSTAQAQRRRAAAGAR